MINYVVSNNYNLSTMSKQLIRIFTQYEENYGFSEGNVAWKNKGGHEFTLKADADLFMYDQDNCISAIKQLLSMNLHHFRTLNL